MLLSGLVCRLPRGHSQGWEKCPPTPTSRVYPLGSWDTGSTTPLFFMGTPTQSPCDPGPHRTLPVAETVVSFSQYPVRALTRGG